MANALKTLFTDIAESIRGGLPDEGLMKPNVFPSKIDEIVALLESAGSGEGGTGSSGSVGNLKFASGSYNVGTNRNRATVTHGFNTMPDLIIVWYTGFYGGTKEEYVEEFPLELAWGMKSKFSSKTLSGYVIPGFGVSANSGINNYTDSIGIYCPDQYTFQFGSSANDGGGRLLTGARYNWLAISGMGGVDSSLVKYVTFIGADGSTLWRMPVLDGDDCKDPYTRGDIEKPTKESTAQYNYTYSGWSLTEGGSADENALKAVTEDKTVYAAFDFEVRTYTITFYDGDTILTSQTLPYGATPSYTPEKSGFSFDGWNPAISTVTGDASYQAKWIEAVTFANGSWEDIMDVVNSGKAATTFKVGDTRAITLTDGTAQTLYILGFDHDDLADGSGKAKMTIGCTTLPYNITVPNGNTSANGGWQSVSSSMKSTLKPQLPSEIRSSVKAVSKLCDGITVSDLSTVSFELFPLSINEMDITRSSSTVFGDSKWVQYYATLGQPYAYFTGIKDSSQYGPKNTGLAKNYFTEKPYYRQRSYSTYADAAGRVAKVQYSTVSSKRSYITQADNVEASGKMTLAFCV